MLLKNHTDKEPMDEPNPLSFWGNTSEMISHPNGPDADSEKGNIEKDQQDGQPFAGIAQRSGEGKANAQQNQRNRDPGQTGEIEFAPSKPVYKIHRYDREQQIDRPYAHRGPYSGNRTVEPGHKEYLGTVIDHGIDAYKLLEKHNSDADDHGIAQPGLEQFAITGLLLTTLGHFFPDRFKSIVSGFRTLYTRKHGQSFLLSPGDRLTNVASRAYTAYPQIIR